LSDPSIVPSDLISIAPGLSWSVKASLTSKKRNGESKNMQIRKAVKLFLQKPVFNFNSGKWGREFLSFPIMSKG
jgi:hypothetical protein